MSIRPDARLRQIPPYIASALVMWGMRQHLAPALMLGALGLTALEQLQADDCRLSAQDYEQLLIVLADYTGRQDLGLVIGAELTVSSYGVLGHAMLSAATVGEAVRLGLDYYRLTSSFMSLDASHDDQVLAIRATPDFDLPTLARFAPEELVVGFTRIARELMGADFNPVTVYFASPPPVHDAALQAFLRCPIVYNHDSCRCDIALNLLSLPLKTANALTASQLLRLCQSLLAQDQPVVAASAELIRQVQQVIKAQPNHWPTMQEAAQRLVLSERTLRRRLHELGTDYQQQVDLIRRQLAQQLLQNPQVSVEQAAAVLGYSEAASFRRAFHRWMGLSPQGYRQQL